MKQKSVETKFMHWWNAIQGNGHAGYVGKEPSREEIVDTFLGKYPSHKEHRDALMALAAAQGDHMLQVWPGWKGGSAPKRAI